MVGGSLENDNYQQLISNQHIRTKTNFAADTPNHKGLVLNQNSLMGSENRISEEKSHNEYQDY